MEILTSAKIANPFECLKCDYQCKKESDYKKHLATKKHTNKADVVATASLAPASLVSASFAPTPFAPTLFAPTPFAPTPFAPTPFAPTPLALAPAHLIHLILHSVVIFLM